MEFMAMLREWLDLRDKESAEVDNRPIPERRLDYERMADLEREINVIVSRLVPNSGHERSKT